MTSAPTDFYPRPPRGGRRLYRHSQADVVNFYPRPPQGGRPLQFPLVRTDDVISIHALREEGDGRHDHQGDRMEISIHALREEGDLHSSPSPTGSRDFYPRPPRGERRRLCRCTASPAGYFYPRPPRGGRLRAAIKQLEADIISIHALREEGDAQRGWSRATPRYFYPRPPRGGRPSPPCWTTTP